MYIHHHTEYKPNQLHSFEIMSSKNRVHTCQGNVREIYFFFKVRELSGNFVMRQRKTKFCKNVREMSGNFTFQPDEARIFGSNIFFLLNS